MRMIADSVRRSVRRRAAASSLMNEPARRSDLHQWAEEHGLQFSAWDSQHLPDLPFTLFQQGDGERRCHNLMSGVWDGDDVRVADFQVHVVQANMVAAIEGQSSLRKYEFDRFFSLALVPAGTSPSTSRVFVTGRSHMAWWRLGDELREVRTEPSAFHSRYATFAGSSDLARRMLQPPMVEFLLDADPRWTYEVVGDTLLVSSERLLPEDLTELVESTRGFVRNIPADFRRG